MLWFWFFMLISNLMVPCIMIGFGKHFSKEAPKKINLTFGYRTSMSMKNKDTWEFAHKYIGKLWFRLGLIILVLSIAPMLIVFGKDVETVGNLSIIIWVVQLVPLVGSIIPTEVALKKAFDKNGKRKIL